MVVRSTTHRLRQEILIFSLRCDGAHEEQPITCVSLHFDVRKPSGSEAMMQPMGLPSRRWKMKSPCRMIKSPNSKGIATITTQHQEAIAELATVQFTLQTTQMTLDFAEAHATVHEAEIALLEAERQAAQSEVAMLHELMSNLRRNQSNETFAVMASQRAREQPFVHVERILRSAPREHYVGPSTHIRPTIFRPP